MGNLNKMDLTRLYGPFEYQPVRQAVARIGSQTSQVSTDARLDTANSLAACRDTVSLPG